MTHPRTSHTGRPQFARSEARGAQKTWNGPLNKYGNPVIKGVSALDAARIKQNSTMGLTPRGIAATRSAQDIENEEADRVQANKAKRAIAYEKGYENYRRSQGFGAQEPVAPDTPQEKLRKNLLAGGLQPNEAAKIAGETAPAPAVKPPAVPGVPGPATPPAALEPATVAGLSPRLDPAKTGKSVSDTLVELGKGGMPASTKELADFKASGKGGRTQAPMMASGSGGAAARPEGPMTQKANKTAAEAQQTIGQIRAVEEARKAGERGFADPAKARALISGLKDMDADLTKKIAKKGEEIAAVKKVGEFPTNEPLGENWNAKLRKASEQFKADKLAQSKFEPPLPQGGTNMTGVAAGGAGAAQVAGNIAKQGLQRGLGAGTSAALGPAAAAAGLMADQAEWNAVTGGSKMQAQQKEASDTAQRNFDANMADLNNRSPEPAPTPQIAQTDEQKKPQSRAMGGPVMGRPNPLLRPDAMRIQMPGGPPVEPKKTTLTSSSSATSATFVPMKRGGKAKGGQTYKVGERGPELFMPKRKDGKPEIIGKDGPQVGQFKEDGVVIPNKAMAAMKKKFSKAGKDAGEKPTPRAGGGGVMGAIITTDYDGMDNDRMMGREPSNRVKVTPLAKGGSVKGSKMAMRPC